MSGTWGSIMRMLTSRAVMNVSMKLRRTSRASGRVLGGSMCSYQTLQLSRRTQRLHRADFYCCRNGGPRGSGVARKAWRNRLVIQLLEEDAEPNTKEGAFL